MKKVKKYFVTFYTQGAFVADAETVEIDHCDPKKIEFPSYAYAFRLSEREDVVDGKKVYMGKEKCLGGTYYHPKSVVETFDQVVKNPNATQTLIGNMKINEWDKIVWNRYGGWPQPFRKGDVVLK